MPPYRWTQYTIHCIVLFFSVAATTHLQGQTFELLDQDRVALIGDGLIEQEQYAGWIEVMLTSAFPDHNVTFRNLGWSGDTPNGVSRCGLSLLQAGREANDEGQKQLQKQIELTQPTVVIFGYGMAASLENQDPQPFIQQYEQLIKFLRATNDKVRLVFLSPIGRLSVPGQAGPVDDATHNTSLQAYRDAIAELAKQSDGQFVDLLETATAPELRRDAIHVNDAGYREVAEAIAKQLGIKQADWLESDQTKLLRTTILRKNEWFFHRSRPANMAYVFGFRKREQGQNAVEIPQFDALVTKEEELIAKLRKLNPVEVKPPAARTKSAYAKFTPQPHPKFTVADGWEVNLWAENPMLNKPIQMNFDPQGRLWVASSEAYPMIEVGQTANDRIIVLEDSNRDGKADKSSVFAEGLLIPTGVIPTHDGAYVAQSTDLLHLQDTNGDGKADKKTRVLSGFGTEDTHHNLHTLRWGPDGRLYMNQSVYTRTDAETPRGVARLKAGGGFRFHPETMRMQVFFAGLWNSWGHQFDKWGGSFLSDGAGFAGLAYTFPGAQFRPVPYGQRTLGLISPGNYPKFCSLEIVSGDSLPEDWQETIVTCDFRANRVTRFSLVEQGSGFETVQQADLLRTPEATFRPIDIKQGPDGALYIADWSNPIINHGEVDFRDPRRDRWHGRIWRVAYKGGKQAKPESFDYTKRSTDDLMKTLNSNDRYARDTARRVLMRRASEPKDSSLASKLADWSKSQDEFGKLQALWLYQAINTPKLDLLEELLTHENANLRTAATRVLADWSDPHSDLPEPLTFEASRAWYEKLIADPHPRVRLEAVTGLSHQKHPLAARIALKTLQLDTDRFIDFALSELVGDVADLLLASLEEQALPTRELEFALASVPPSKATSFLRSYLEKNQLDKDGSGPWIELIAKSGGKAELSQLFAQAVAGDFNDGALARALSALANAKRLRKLAPEGDLSTVSQFFSSNNEAVQQQAITLAGRWNQKELTPKLVALADQNDGSKPIRLAAIDALSDLRSAEELKAIKPQDPELAARVLSGLATVAPDAALSRFLELQSASQDLQEADFVAYWRAILSNKANQNRLPEQLQGARLPGKSVQAGLRVAREGGRKAKQLVERLQQMEGESFEELTPEQIMAMAKAAEGGDPFRGEQIYRKQELACVTCHAITGMGGKVGPELSSIGASAPLDYLAESLYKPNAKVKENYHSTMVLDADGQQHVGIESGSTPDEVVLRLADDKLRRIPRNEIEDQSAGPSLMPAGLIERLPRQDQIDLLAFLAKLGKPGAFDTSQQDVARQFEILAGTHRAEQKGLASILSGKAPGWKPAQARVNGELTKNAMTEATKQPINISLVTVYLKTRFTVSDSNSHSITVLGSREAQLWLDGKKLTTKAGENRTLCQLKAEKGERELIIRLDARELPESIRVVCDNVTF